MTGADAVAEILKREGTEYLFCFPTTPIIEAAARRGIRPIIARTERTVINMADGYSRVSNGDRIGVCATQYGPGIENAFGGVAQACADSSPILILPLTEDPSYADTKPAFGAVENYRGITKWVGSVNSPDRIPQFMRRAFTLLRTGHPAPVVIEIPRDMAAAKYPSAEIDYTPVEAIRSAGDPACVERAADLLAGSSRPCIVAGQGVLYSGGTGELVQLAELLDAPVASTLMAKSVFPENHPLSVGVANTRGSLAWPFVEGSDLILALGASLSAGLMLAPLPGGTALIHNTVNEFDISKSYPTTVGLLGDSKLVLGQLIQALAERLKRKPRRNGSIRPDIRVAKQNLLKEWLPAYESSEKPIRPFRVIWDLMRTVDRTQIIVTHDSGMPRGQVVSTFEAIEPRGYIGWGNSTQLGTGLGLAMGSEAGGARKARCQCDGRRRIRNVGHGHRIRGPAEDSHRHGNPQQLDNGRPRSGNADRHRAIWIVAPFWRVRVGGRGSRSLRREDHGTGRGHPRATARHTKVKGRHAGRAGIHNRTRALAEGSGEMAKHTFEQEIYHTTLGPHPPVLEVDAGDTVSTTTVDAGGWDRNGDHCGARVNPQTGPILVRGAEPGDTLVVSIDHLWPNRSSGFTSGAIAPNVTDFGYTPEFCDEVDRANWRIDRDAGTARLESPKGLLTGFVLSLAPMIGCFGVAPERGQSISTATSGPHGGNMDYRGLRAGCHGLLPGVCRRRAVPPGRRPRHAGGWRDRGKRDRDFDGRDRYPRCHQGKDDSLAPSRG